MNTRFSTGSAKSMTTLDQTFGEFTVVKVATPTKGGNLRWRVRHSCGLVTVARASHVRQERVQCRCATFGRVAKHAAIVKAFEDSAIQCLNYCMPHPGEVDVSGKVIGVLNGIDAHDDCHLGDESRWSAFYVLHNDGCRVWGRGVGLTPKEGETFAMNIHARHGVLAKRKSNQVFLAVHADGRTEREARAKLREILRSAVL